MDDIASGVRSGLLDSDARVTILGADAPCAMSASARAPTRSVDLRLKAGGVHCVYALAELKYSRASSERALEKAEGRLGWLRDAISNQGYLVLGDRKYTIRAQAVGALGVSLHGWRLRLQMVGLDRTIYAEGGPFTQRLV